MNIRRLTAREKTILTVFVIIVMIYGIYNLGYRDIKRQGYALDGKIRKAKALLQKHRRVIRKSAALSARYEEIFERFRQRQSGEEVMSVILSEIESAARKADMAVEEMKPRSIRAVDFYNHFAVSLTVNGSLEKILEFVHNLEFGPHRFQIDELDLRRPFFRSDNLRCQLVVSRILIP